MMNSSSNPPHSPFGPIVAKKLTRDNFVLWKAQFLPGVRGAHAMGIPDGMSPEPPKTLTIQKDGKSEELPNSEHETWVANDQKLLSHLLNSISKDVLGQVATFGHLGRSLGVSPDEFCCSLARAGHEPASPARQSEERRHEDGRLLRQDEEHPRRDCICW
jgi:hypothetical protein